jgi:predicted permease
VPVSQQLVGVLVPVFALAGIGVGWRLFGVPFDREFVTRIVMNIGTPCLILNTLLHLSLPLEQFTAILLAAVMVLVAVSAVAFAIVRVLGLPVRSFVPPLVFGNTGNTGLPLCLFAFGQDGLGLGIAFYVVGSSAQFIFAPLFQSAKPAWRTLFTTPVIYAAILGLGLLSADVAVPAWLERLISLLAGLAIPLMMIAMGHSLAGFRVARLPTALGLGVVRLALGFGAGVAISSLLGLEGLVRNVVILQSAMPAAVFNYLLAARYNRHPEDVAGIVLVSSVIAALALPLLLSWLLGQ